MGLWQKAATLGLAAALLGLSPFFGVAPAASAAASDAPLEIVIAPDSFVDELVPLRDWRESQGLRVDIVTTTFVHAQMAGRDLQESIKAYLAARRAADPRLEYVLLAADDPIIPGRLLQVANRTALPSMPAEDRSLVSDYYYASEAASFFNASDLGDDYPSGPPWYGISDSSWNLTASLHVGRIPAQTEGELAAYVARLLSWEQAPPSGAWSSRALFGLAVSSVPDAGFASRRSGDDASVAFAPAVAAAAGSGLLNITLADYPAWPAPYDPQDDLLDSPTFLGEWGLGASLVALAARDSPLSGGPGEAYAGDGSSSVFAPVATVAGIDALPNGVRLPLWVAAYGGSANFSAGNGSAAERALRAPSGGAALAVGFTGRTSAGAPAGSVQGGWTLAASIVREALERPGPLGDVVDRARQRFVEDARAALGAAFDPNNSTLRRALAGLTLLGDPASVPWTGPSRPLDIVVPPGIAPNSAVDLAVTVTSSGAGVANATVAVLDESGALVGVGTTDGAGVALVALITGARANWSVVVTAPGFGRASKAVAVDAPPNVVIVTPGQGTSVGGRLNFTGVAGDSDPGDLIAAVEVSLNGGAWVAAAGFASWSFEVDTLALANGPNTFAARASDGTVWSDPFVAAFNVTNARPPSAIAAYGPLSVLEDGTLTVDLGLSSHFRATGPLATLSAEVASPDRLRLNVSGEALRIEPERNANGPMVIVLTVRDSYGGALSLNVSVVVVPVDDPPVLTVATQYTVDEGGTVTFDPFVFDPDGTHPVLFVESGPENATPAGWRTPRGASGLYAIRLSASDGRFVVSANLTVNVISFNSPPNATIAAPERAEAGRVVGFLASGVSDADGDPVTASWDFSDGQTAEGNESSHVFATPGTYFVKLTLFDGRQSVLIEKAIVIDPYRPPGSPPQGYAPFVAYGSVAVILVCAALATYLLFVRAPRAGPYGARAGRGKRPDRDEEEE